MIIEAEFDHDDVVDVYFGSTAKAGFRQKYSKRSDSFAAGVRSSGKVRLNNHIVRKMRIDTGIEPGRMKLYSIRLASNFGPGLTLDHRDIYDNFLPNESVTVFRLEQDHILIETNSSDPFIIFSGDLVQDNFFLGTLLPLIMALVSYLLWRGISWRSIPAYHDIRTKSSSAGVKYGSLDGVRGLAALLVLAQHTGLTKTGGIFGVWLFFCLSGFLLASPFIRQPSLAISGSYMSNYLFRRVKRIVPMYYVMITIIFLFAGKIPVAIRHYLFLQADGHFWSISQEMFFYLILPLVMALSYLICRNRRLLQILFLMLCALAAYRYFTADFITLYGNNAHLKPYASIFLTGVAAAYIYSYTSVHFTSTWRRPPVTTLFSLAGILILGGCLFISAHPLDHLAHINPLSRPGIFGFASGLFILATMLAKNSILDRAMNLLPLKAIGIVGYSFYLLHPKLIDCVRATTLYFWDYYPTGITIFLLAGFATYLVTLFTYSYIERPFIKKQVSPAAPPSS